MTAGRQPKQLDDQKKWRIVAARNLSRVSAFIYAVRSTGVYCRPGCSSRLPRRENVEFFDSADLARRAGYRACLRCKPDQETCADTRLVAACEMIRDSADLLSMDAIAQRAGVSADHLHRLFVKHLGVTPRQYAATQRVNRLQKNLTNGKKTMIAIHESGYVSSGRCYAEAGKRLGMTPAQYRQGNEADIRYAITGCSLGRMIVGMTDIGVCRIAFGDHDEQLRKDLLSHFPAASQIRTDEPFQRTLDAVVRMVDSPKMAAEFPLDIRGTAFQQKVWKALQEIPPGETRSYAQVARAIGRPTASRAVASACGDNPVAVAVPCHRVVKSDGSVSGYRWGVERKKKLLKRESQRIMQPDAAVSDTPTVQPVVGARSARSRFPKTPV